MKKILLVGVLALMTFLAACSSAKHRSPSEVIEAAYVAANEGRYSETEKYLSSDALEVTKGELGQLAGGLRLVWDIATKDGTIDRIEITEETIRGEGAIVKFRLHFKDGSTRDDYEPLIKEGGVWKIAIG